MVLDLNTFHILTTDVKDTVYIRLKKGCSIVVGNCLYFSLVQQKSSFDQRFAISGRAGVNNLNTFRQFTVNILDRTDCCTKRISFVIMIERIKQWCRLRRQEQPL